MSREIIPGMHCTACNKELDPHHPDYMCSECLSISFNTAGDLPYRGEDEMPIEIIPYDDEVNYEEH